MRYLAVIPARGGSKGIPHKNIIPVCGRPLICYTLDVAVDLGLTGDIVVSTESEDVMEAVRAYSQVEILRRPAELAQDRSSTEEVLVHAVNAMQRRFQKEYDAVITLQPTSPLRRKATVLSFLEEFEKKQPLFDAQLTVTETSSDFWIKDANGYLKRLFPEAPRRRQERRPLFVENSCIYVTKTESLLKSGSVLGTRVNGYPIPEIEGIDINEAADIRKAEAYLLMERKEG